MKKLLLLATVGLTLVSCSSKKTQCTTEDKSKWQNEEDFQAKLVAEGYKINKFKVTEGNCYEIYGWDKEQNKVEIYFSPIDGSIVKKEMH
ncbi:PepSY domain-containing protein [Halobacteriovorax sp. XZX-3]|uniref:PepSY domain-containing protein n=1 Tax=unclassified Halobacteriovorax TaxID=2639665 RepID=UPI000CD053CC|nr:PepSY domain-containing protein [Halobacteriovorax sp. DA5]POB13576.1 PepSY domain-containing protein [Halobacteriovorax sp. DA5]